MGITLVSSRITKSMVKEFMNTIMESNMKVTTSTEPNKDQEFCTMVTAVFHTKAYSKTVCHMDWEKLTIKRVKLLKQIGFKASINNLSVYEKKDWKKT